MTPYVYLIDEFFPPYEFELVQAYAHQLEYKPVEAPFDHVVYPNIGLPVPEVVIERIAQSMTWLMGYKVIPKHNAFRLSPRGSNPPQWAHSDGETARWAFFCYINPGPSATVLLEHRRTGMRTHPAGDEELQAWKDDHNNVDAWRVVGEFPGAPNRALVMRSDLMHGAIPREGYGEDRTDARLILLSFFD
jgi:hypothetical protein